MKDGASRRQHFEAVQKQTGKKPRELDGPTIPPGCDLVWQTFLRLSGRRGATDMGTPLPVTYTEVLNFSRLTYTSLRPDEVESIMDLDDLWREVVAASQKKADAGGGDEDR